MTYHRIYGPPSTYATGALHHCQAPMQPGFDLFNSSAPIDAPECIPAGGVYRIEWDSLTQDERAWFPAQQITLRSYA